METVEQYLHNLYRIQPDFMYSVSREFARSCQTPMLVMPDDTPSHSYEAAMALVALAPRAQATEYPWKESAGHKGEDDRPGARLPQGAPARANRRLKGSGRGTLGRWLPGQDSNLGQGSQSPLCYHYTTGHRAAVDDESLGDSIIAYGCRGRKIEGRPGSQPIWTSYGPCCG